MRVRRAVRLRDWWWVYSKPAAEGSLSRATTSMPARRKASSVMIRWAEWAWAGTEAATWPTGTGSASRTAVR